MRWNGPNGQGWNEMVQDGPKLGRKVNWNMQGKIYKRQMFELGQILLLGGKENQNFLP